ncbi:hypothetical protein [Pseudomonas cichorii]|uniref:hypothetical protein n=1 Tax=Pseudomonas cichorii TaxID=36746 RepID=UPI000EFFD3E0|nr:hypothetical protein [Pseudomonas cichorii]
MLITIIACLLLGGCAARVKQGGSQELRIQESAKPHLVVTFVGSKRVVASSDWYLLKGMWSQALSTDAKAEGYDTFFLGGKPQTQPRDGVMVVIHVSNFLDLRTGQTLGSRTYDSYSLGWQMWFSAMTDKQLRKISRLMIADIKAAPGW